jgi:hypothetical protein
MGMSEQGVAGVTLYALYPRDTGIMVLADGFFDALSLWLPERPEVGVWLSEQPLDANDGLPDGWDTVLEVRLSIAPEELRKWEWAFGEQRAYLIPATVVNTIGTVRLLEQHEASEDEIQAILAKHEAWFRSEGMVGEQLEEAMRKDEDFLRRPWLS